MSELALTSPLAIPPEETTRAPGSLRIGPLDRFDRWALWLIGVVFVLQLLAFSRLVPAMTDTWYHLTLAKEIREGGWLFGWDDWRYLPIGRPQVFPPLLHLLIAGISIFTGSIISAGQVCAVTFLPAAMLTTWYCARRLLNSRIALIAALFLLADIAHYIIMEAYIASCLINILMPLAMVAFLQRRAWWAILFLTLMNYSHIALPHCVSIGFVIFGLVNREYLRLALKVVGISFLFFIPWLPHVLDNLDFLMVLHEGGVPGSLLEKMSILQFINLPLAALGFWGLLKGPRSQASALSVCLIVGFLPILFTYGGRYNMHTMPLWAILGAGILQRRLPLDLAPRRLLRFVCLVLIPWPTLFLNLGQGQVAPIPISGADAVVLATLAHPLLSMGDTKSEAYRRDCDDLVAWLNASTRPGEIIYTNTIWVAEMITLLSDRRTDMGHWWECSKESAIIYGHALRDWAPEAVFVYVRPEADTGGLSGTSPLMHGVDRRFTIGRFQIGLRDARRLVGQVTRPVGGTGGSPVRSRSLTAPTGTGLVTCPTGWTALSAAGAEGRANETPEGFIWTIPTGQGAFASVSAPLHDADIAGVELRVSATETTDDLTLGVRLADGTELRWPLSIAEPNVAYGVRTPLRWMTDAYGNTRPLGPVREVYLSRAPDKELPERKRKEMTVTVTDVKLLVEWPLHKESPDG